MEAIKKIDLHAHVIGSGRITPPDPFNGQNMPTAEELLGLYDKLGIERGVLLPIVSPEGQRAAISNETCILTAEKYPDRFSWFCNVDPRAIRDRSTNRLSYLLDFYKNLGAKGLGELTSNLYADDPLTDHLFSCCEEVGLPVLFHISPSVRKDYGIADDLGLPRLEKMIRSHPRLQFIGHSQPFWSEISADNSDEIRNTCPDGPVRPGRLWTLMRTYRNLTCDLSAASGRNAMMRDPENAVAFLTEFQDRLYYGCDICSVEKRHPFLFRAFLDSLAESGALPMTAYRKICRDNAAALLGL